MKIFGLDLGTNSIKAVCLQPSGSKYRLLNLGMAPMPASLKSESETDHKKIAEAINKLLSTTGIKLKTAVLSLSESQVFSRVIEMTPLSDAELKNAIKWEAEQYIPIPLEEASLDYQVIERPKAGAKKEKMEVFLAAAPKSLVEKYLQIMRFANLQPIALETELIAISRALTGQVKTNGQHNLIISIGSQSTDLAIIRDRQIVYTRSINTGGNALARVVAKELNLEVKQAEEYKKSYGLDEQQLEGKVSTAIRLVFDAVIQEIKKAVIFYEQKEKAKLKSVILSGGTVKLPGVVGYLAESLGLEIEVGDAFRNVIIDEKQKSLPSDDALLYTTAIGLAMKKV